MAPLPPIQDEMTGSPKGRPGLLFAALRVLLALAISFLIFQIKLDYVEAFLYDLRVRARPAPAASDMIEIVLFDAKSVEELHTTPDFQHLAQFLGVMKKAQPKALLQDFVLSDIKGDDESKLLFTLASNDLPQAYLLTDELPMKGQKDAFQLPPPFDHLKVAAAPKTVDERNFGKDGVTRRFVIDYQGHRTLHPELAATVNPAVSDNANIRGVFSFLSTTQAYINFRPPGSYPITSFKDVLNGKVPPEHFQGKFVIVGIDTQMSDHDYAATPYTRDVVGMTSAEVHANILDTLIRNDSPEHSPVWLNYIVGALIGLLTVYVVFSVRPAAGLIILGTTLAGYMILSWLMFWLFGLWIDTAHPLATVFLCYYFFIPYRLIVENRRSWEIYQKHRLLQQVEELKTNFISMMSHDLKTPIARIQGMTDIIQSDNTTALSNTQREALDTIRQSNDDLLKFINSILQYGKIEAQHIQLHLQPKDVNLLLEDVVRKHEFLAKLKHITVKTELETLFPAPVDPELLKQVFSNLLENAIKYSPEGTSVLISSEEKDARILVQVADQGPGIPADELPHIFMKFFRSNRAKSSPIKGTGLGLYLAKYFTELHGGKLTVESSYGQGCTFTVDLPLEGVSRTGVS